MSEAIQTATGLVHRERFAHGVRSLTITAVANEGLVDLTIGDPANRRPTRLTPAEARHLASVLIAQAEIAK